MTSDNALDLTDDEWAQLDQALGAMCPRQVDVGWLDGYLAGLCLQPQPPSAALWTAAALGAMPQDQAGTVIRLSHQRLRALRAALRNQIWWDPFIRVQANDAEPTSAELLSEWVRPWVAGLEQSLHDFKLPQVEDNPAWMMVLARLYRHLPASDDQDREVIAVLNEAHPLSTLEDAVDELTACVGELWDLVPHPDSE